MTTDEFLDLFFGEGRGPDPMRAAQKGMKRELPKRFYKEAALLRQEDGTLALALDGRLARTPARKPLAVARPEIAEAIAAEWRAQEREIDPARMPLTRLTNVALDRVSETMAEVRAETAAYAGSDLLCYRAGEPERLVERQAELWDPPLAWAERALGARLHRTCGIIHAPQPEASLAALGRALEAETDPLVISALSVVTTLTGSLVLALALRAGAITAETAWAAAHVDEDVQAEIWGVDAEALARRAGRKAEFDAAALVLAGR